MEIVQILKEEFDEYASNHPMNNYYQTSKYGMLMDRHNFDDYYLAMKDENGKLIMNFSMENLSINSFPDLKNFKEHINGTYSINNLPDTCKSFCENALKTLSRDSIKMMKISDFNTSGVLGSNDLDNIKSQWRALIYDEGNSQKDSKQAAGSFGLGKNAPFALSGINTVFYTTRDKDGLYAFEGVAKLHTSYINGQKYEPKIYFSNLYNIKSGQLLVFSFKCSKKNSSLI